MKLHFWQFWTFSQFKNWFFDHLWNCKKMEFGKKNFFLKLIFLISRVFFWPGLFIIFWPTMYITYCVLLFRLIGLIGQRSDFDQQRFWICYRRGIASWSREPLHLAVVMISIHHFCKKKLTKLYFKGLAITIQKLIV